MDNFKIDMETWDDKRKVKGRFIFTVETIYKSEQVERYKIIGGKKEITLEKNLLVKSKYYKNWKIRDANFKMEVKEDVTIMTLVNIYKKIDEHNNGTKKIAWQRTES